MKQVQSVKKLAKAGLAVTLAIGLGGVGVGCWGEDSAQPKIVQPAASCPDLSEAANQLISSDQKLAKTNHYIDFVYKTAQSLAADEPEKNKIMGEQCAWLDQVNKCVDMACMSKKADARLAELSDFNYGKMKDNSEITTCPEIKFMEHESDKTFCINRLANKKRLTLYVGQTESDKKNESLCRNLLGEMISNKIDFIEPLVMTDDVDNPLIKEFQGYKYLNKQIGDWDTIALNETCHGFERYHLSDVKLNSGRPVEILYSNMCDQALSNYGTSTHVRILDTKTKKQISIFPLSLRMPENLYGIIRFNDVYYLLENNSQYIYMHPYDAKKEIFLPSNCDFEFKD